LLVVTGDGMTPAEPLWARVPTRCEDGERLSDFMMLIPRLRTRPAHHMQEILESIHDTLSCYGDTVVFADLNLRLNLLWVSVRPRPGICLALASALQTRIPEARLIANRAELLMRERGRWWQRYRAY